MIPKCRRNFGDGFTVFHFLRNQTCLRVEGGRFRHICRHVMYVMYFVIWGNLRPLTLPCVWVRYHLNPVCYINIYSDYSVMYLGKSFHCRYKCSLQERMKFVFEFRYLCVPMKPSGSIGCPLTFWQNGMLQTQYEAQGKWVWKRIDATEGNYCTLLPPAPPLPITIHPENFNTMPDWEKG